MLLLCFLDKSPLDKVKRTLKMETKKKEHGSRRKTKTKKKERNTVNEKGIL